MMTVGDNDGHGESGSMTSLSVLGGNTLNGDTSTSRHLLSPRLLMGFLNLDALLSPRTGTVPVRLSGCECRSFWKDLDDVAL